MLDQLKKMAMEHLGQKMLNNVLSDNDTSAAAEEGAGSIVDTITGMLGGGKLDMITDLFSNNGNSMESNGLFQDVISKFSGVLENKGMAAEEAQKEAQSVVPSVISSLQEKFQSEKEEDKDFDLSALSNLAGGDMGGMLNKVKGLFS
ncbi:MAG: hypothetical protein AB8B53_02225 [Flavobacteriales bacterium]